MYNESSDLYVYSKPNRLVAFVVADLTNKLGNISDWQTTCLNTIQKEISKIKPGLDADSFEYSARKILTAREFIEEAFIKQGVTHPQMNGAGFIRQDLLEILSSVQQPIARELEQSIQYFIALTTK